MPPQAFRKPLDNSSQAVLAPGGQHPRDFTAKPAERNAVTHHQDQPLPASINALVGTTSPVLRCVQSGSSAQLDAPLGGVGGEAPGPQVAESPLAFEQASRRGVGSTVGRQMTLEGHRRPFVNDQCNFKPA